MKKRRNQHSKMKKEVRHLTAALRVQLRMRMLMSLSVGAAGWKTRKRGATLKTWHA